MSYCPKIFLNRLSQELRGYGAPSNNALKFRSTDRYVCLVVTKQDFNFEQNTFMAMAVHARPFCACMPIKMSPSWILVCLFGAPRYTCYLLTLTLTWLLPGYGTVTPYTWGMEKDRAGSQIFLTRVCPSAFQQVVFRKCS